MSNFLSLAVVTAVLQEMVQEALRETVPGATVRVGPPRPPSAASGPEVSLYLYQLTANAALRNRDLPNRQADGSLAHRPAVAVDLHYLISFFGEQELATERMAGKVATRFQAHPALTPEQIRAVIRADGPFAFLSGSDLAKEPDLVKVTPQFLSLEELSKLWTVFFQMAHRLSLQYIVGPVVVEADLSPVRALPATERRLAVSLAPSPQIEEVVPDAVEAGVAITLRIRGANLVATTERVEIDGIDTPFERGDGELLVPQLPATLLAGVQQVQAIGKSAVRSNGAAILLRPQIVRADFALVPDPAQSTGTPALATIQVEAVPFPGARQTARLLLNLRGKAEGFSFESMLRFAVEGKAARDVESLDVSAAVRAVFAAHSIPLSNNVTIALASTEAWRLDDVDGGRTYAIRRDAQGMTAYFGLQPGAEMSSLAFRLPAASFVPPGTYLLRLQTGPPPVAESLLTKTGGRFTAPVVVVPAEGA